ncbi:MAG: hypothetical protein ABEJ40_04125 [Haloarculaceae archaeon]
MPESLYRAAVFALYQLSLLAGILLLPMALVARRFGVTIPVHRLVSRFGEAYERSAANTA